jgi:hypothetical protein
MDWLKDIIKHLAVSRTLVTAVFITALTMFAGPKFVPNIIPEVPKEWSPVLFAAMVLSGSLLVLWAIEGLWKLLAHGVRSTTASIAAASLSPRESELLLVMGINPAQPLNLDAVAYENAPFTRLELSALVKQLEQKGLVKLNEWNEDLVTLTQAGKDRALKLQRQRRGQDAA